MVNMVYFLIFLSKWRHLHFLTSGKQESFAASVFAAAAESNETFVFRTKFAQLVLSGCF